jgi:hypothetical protein
LVSRHELLEKLLAARFDLDYAPRETKAHFQKNCSDCWIRRRTSTIARGMN